MSEDEIKRVKPTLNSMPASFESMPQGRGAISPSIEGAKQVAHDPAEDPSTGLDAAPDDAPKSVAPPSLATKDAEPEPAAPNPADIVANPGASGPAANNAANQTGSGPAADIAANPTAPGATVNLNEISKDCNPGTLSTPTSSTSIASATAKPLPPLVSFA